MMYCHTDAQLGLCLKQFKIDAFWSTESQNNLWNIGFKDNQIIIETGNVNDAVRFISFQFKSIVAFICMFSKIYW